MPKIYSLSRKGIVGLIDILNFEGCSSMNISVREGQTRSSAELSKLSKTFGLGKFSVRKQKILYYKSSRYLLYLLRVMHTFYVSCRRSLNKFPIAAGKI